jgi:hypothetical protein
MEYGAGVIRGSDCSFWVRRLIEPRGKSVKYVNAVS